MKTSMAISNSELEAQRKVRQMNRITLVVAPVVVAFIAAVEPIVELILR